MIRQIRFIAIVAIGLVVFIGTSLAPAAFAFPQGANTIQSIKQANYCFEAGCSNQASNTATSQHTNTVQSISQVNVCAKADCSNSATNTVK
jgi:hypothetical protein